MIRPDQIPDEVVKAALNEWWRNGARWSDVVAAAINAWPGAERVFRQPHRRAVSYSDPAFILPLPQKDDT
jgi:hypothetical protein